MAEEGGSGIWIWPFLGVIDVLWMFLLKISPSFRESMSFGLSMTFWFQITVFILVIFFIIALSSILHEVKQTSSLYSAEMMGPPMPGMDDEIIEAEIIEAEVIEETEEEEKPERRASRKIYEYPPVPEPGINVDTFIRVGEDFIVKIRTKVAEENEV